MHYELLLPSQVRQKCAYYTHADWLPPSFRDLDRWRRSSFDSLTEPFRPHLVYAHPSWLKRYEGRHPAEVVAMVDEVAAGHWPDHALRDTADVERVLASRKYALRRGALQAQCATLPVAKRAVHTAKARIRELPYAQPLRELTRKHRSEPALEPLGESPNWKALLTGWQDARIPAEQRRLTDSELEELRAGRPPDAWTVLAEAVRATGHAADGELVEVGCSTGYLSTVLVQLLGHPITYTGIDYSQAMIAVAVRDYPETRFLVGDAEDLPLEDNSCDVLISGCVLLHVGDVVQAIRESTRVTRDWVILHKTPVVQGETRRFRKLAYGIPCLETHFGEQDLIQVCRTEGLQLIEVLEITSGEPAQRDYVFRKSGRPADE
jgi:SAM-dependent methyltransferase